MSDQAVSVGLREIIGFFRGPRQTDSFAVDTIPRRLLGLGFLWERLYAAMELEIAG
jgi:hypothetical protein